MKPIVFELIENLFHDGNYAVYLRISCFNLIVNASNDDALFVVDSLCLLLMSPSLFLLWITFYLFNFS